MSIDYRATIVTGYLITPEEEMKYVDEEMYEYFDDLDFIHYVDHYSGCEGAIVVGLEIQHATPDNSPIEITNQLSIEGVRQIIDALDQIFPDLPYNPDRTIKDYLICEVW